MSDYQAKSWFDPSGIDQGKSLQFPEGWLVAQIFFPTNGLTLDADDRKALDLLYSAFAPLVLGPHPQKFTLIGRADHRDTDEHNLGLSESRARAVNNYLDQRFKSMRNFQCEARCKGEAGATLSSDPDILAGDRRVDVFAPSKIDNPAIIVIKPIKVTGGHTGKLVWDEIDPEAPSTSIAGKTSSPPKSAGDASSEVVGFLQGTFDDVQLKLRIGREFKARRSEAIGYLRGHGKGGILAEAYLIVRYDPSNAVGVRGQKPLKNYGPVAKRFSHLHIGSVVYAQPEHALSVREAERKRHRFMEELPNPNCEYAERRYFWGHWK